MKSIKTLLIAMVVAVIVFSLGTVTVLNYFNSEKLIKTELESEIGRTTQVTANELGTWIDMRKTEMEMLANSPVLISGDKAAIIKYLGGESKRLNSFSAMWVSDMDGNWYSPVGTSGSIKERAYYKELLTSGQPVISDPLIGKADGKMAFVVAVPIRQDGRVVGIIGGNVKMDEFLRIVSAIKVGQTGYAAVFAPDGMTVVHPNKDYIMQYNPLSDESLSKEIKDAYAAGSRGENGIKNYKLAGQEKYLAYTPIPGVKWTLSVTAVVDEFMGPLKSLTTTAAVTTIVILIIAVLLVIFASERMIRPLKVIQYGAEKIAQGDLDAKINVKAKNEFGMLAQSFAIMVQNLKNLIGQVANSVNTVAVSSGNLTASAQQSAQAACQVADSIASVVEDNEKQRTAEEAVFMTVEEMSGKIKQVAENTGSVVATSSKTAEAAHEGGKAIEVVVKQMETIEKTVVSSAQAVQMLGESSKEIGQIVDTISGIAGQTNLLALNAAIEAARAGELGKGFAVVADEVRKLAEQSQKAAMQIAQLINGIQNDTSNAVAVMNEGTREVRKGSEVVHVAGEAFAEIAAMVDEVSDQIKDISQVVGQMADSSQQIISSIKEFENVRNHASQEVAAVSAATQAQSAFMEEIASSSQNLSSLAGQLQSAIDKFKL